MTESGLTRLESWELGNFDYTEEQIEEYRVIIGKIAMSVKNLFLKRSMPSRLDVPASDK